MTTEKLKKLASLCKASITLEYRSQSAYYDTIKKAVENEGEYWAPDEFLSAEDRQKCLETDIYWTLHFYPNSPVGFHHAHASDVDMLLDWALEILEAKQ